MAKRASLGEGNQTMKRQVTAASQDEGINDDNIDEASQGDDNDHDNALDEGDESNSHDDTPSAPAVHVNASDDAGQASGGGQRYVIVGCKIPNGIILRRHRMVTTYEPVMGGGTRKVKVAQHVGEKFHIKGPATHFGMQKEGVVAGAMLNFGVPADLWESWLHDNKDSAMVRNGLVFAHTQPESSRAIAEERRPVKSNLEPLSVPLKNSDAKSTDVRVTRGLATGHPNLTNIGPADTK